MCFSVVIPLIRETELIFKVARLELQYIDASYSLLRYFEKL